jgi:plasmid stabilization system protein ParE
MGRGGFSSRGSFGVRSGFVGTPRFGAGFGTGFQQPFFRPRQPFFGIRQPFFGPRRFHRRVFFATGSPFHFGYYGYPGYYGGYSYAMQDSYPAYDYYAAYSAQNDAAQQQEIDRLEDEVARLREQRESREAPPPIPQAENRSLPSTPTLLVFRDKHTQEVQNYAVVGGTLWIFNEQRATKLPLSWLDIEATTKVNDERGVDFQVPKHPM